MRTLIIGGSGFVGAHLIHELVAFGHDVFATAAEPNFGHLELSSNHLFIMDVNSPQSVGKIMKSIEPEWVVHLAAQSSVSRSWTDPVETSRVNILGSIVLLEVVRNLSHRPRILCVGSSEEYGVSFKSSVIVSEEGQLLPVNPYGASKQAQEIFSRIWFSVYGLDIVLTRSFPHIGPGQALGFVVPDLCCQIARIEQQNADPVISVGNIDSSRDMTDVRDVVRGYRLLLQNGKSGEVYNVGSGRSISVRQILDALVNMSRTRIKIQIDPSKLRPSDVPLVVANIDKIKKCTGWQPEIQLVKTLADTLQFWKERL
jgi:GDP-4-dehydro-6-deoxy-D-mannose reductase